MWLWVLLACGSSGPAPEVLCSSVKPSVDSVRQLAAAARTQAKQLQDFAGKPPRPVQQRMVHRQGEPHRTEAHHVSMFRSLCYPLASASTELAAHLPAPWGRKLKAAGEKLQPVCGTVSRDTATELHDAVLQVERAVGGHEQSCRDIVGEAEPAPPPDPAYQCTTSKPVLHEVLSHMRSLHTGMAALEDQRDVMRAAVEEEPFDPVLIEDALVLLGEREGVYGVGCSNLMKVSLAHARAIGSPAAELEATIVAMKERCEALPEFSAKDEKSPTHDLEAAEVGAAVAQLYRKALQSHEATFADCERW